MISSRISVAVGNYPVPGGRTVGNYPVPGGRTTPALPNGNYYSDYYNENDILLAKQFVVSGLIQYTKIIKVLLLY